MDVFFHELHVSGKARLVFTKNDIELSKRGISYQSIEFGTVPCNSGKIIVAVNIENLPSVDFGKIGTVKVLSVVLEESSKRYVITFRQLGEDSDETIRSERTDGRRGKDVMQLWGRDLKNHICILFKHNEESKDPSKSGGFRVAPYVIDLGLQKN